MISGLYIRYKTSNPGNSAYPVVVQSCLLLISSLILSTAERNSSTKQYYEPDFPHFSHIERA